jgi:G3E family GTPase
VILEGLADPNAALAGEAHAAVAAQVSRIAPGCLCCAGNLVLRVTLNRLLRRPPAHLFVSLADATHVGQLRAMLSAPPYDSLLSLCDDIEAPLIAA